MKVKNILSNDIILKGITWGLYGLAILVYELLYCNSNFVKNILSNNIVEFNFSIVRIVFYIIFLLLLYKFNNYFLENSIKTMKNKIKRICIYLYIPIFITGIILALVLINTNYGLIATGACLIALILIMIFLIYISDDLIKNIIVIVFTVGVIFCIATPFNHALDEKKHFMTAFNISFGNFDYEKKYITDRQVDILPQISKFTTIEEYTKTDYNPNITTEVSHLDLSSTPAGNNFIMYLPSSLGITIARYLNGSIIDLYVTGRLFNLIAYALIIILTLKILPYKKYTFYLIFTMPLPLLLAASFSIDGYCIALVGLFTAYCLYIQNKEIRIKEILILILLFGLVLLTKSMAYIGVGFLIFALPIIKIIKENKKYISLLFLIIVIALAIICFMGANVKIESDTRYENTNSNMQINDIIENPIKLVILFYRHVRDVLLNFEWLSNLNPNVYFYTFSKCVFLFMLLFIFIVSLYDEENLKFKNKVINVITFLLVFATTSIALYIGTSAVGSLKIDGYQARYILPVLPLLLINLKNEYIKVSFNKLDEKIIIPLIWSTFTIIDIIGLIMI